MKLLKGLILVFLSFVISTTNYAQDIHFSQFHLSPLTTNPALTGAYEGTFRIGGIYRDQWGSILENQFRTPAVYLDAPIVRGIGKNDWLGAGVYVLNDRAGSAALTNLTAMVSLSYHLALGKKANTYFSVGGQGGLVQKRIDQTKLTFQDQFVDGVLNPNMVSGDFNGIETNVSYPDFQVGGVLSSYITSKFNVYIGMSAFHLTEPDDPFLVDSKLPARLLVHGGMEIDMSNRVTLSPRVLFQTQTAAREIMPQLSVGYHLNPERTYTFNIGGGYRVGDAAIAMLGLDLKGFRFGAAYDINISDLTSATNYRGGFELALSYTAKVYKNPIVKPVLFCPRF